MSKRFLGFLLTLVLCLFVAGCGKTPTLTLEVTSVTLKAGEVYEVKPIIENAEDTSIVLTAQDKTLVSVEGNKITALKAGSTVVEVALKANAEIKANLNVVIEATPKVEVTGANTVYAGDEIQLEAKLTDIEGIVTWKSENKEVAKVDQSGKVTGVAPGKVVISATLGDVVGKLEVTVKGKPEIAIEGAEFTAVGQTLTLEAVGKYLEAGVKWSSSDTAVATVENGVVTAVAKGTVTITAECEGFKATKEITVYGTKVVISGPTSVYVGEEIELTATIEEAPGEGPYLFTWESNLDSCAVVNSGKVIGIQEGTVVITAKTEGFSGTYEIEVVLRREVTVKGELAIDLGDTGKLTLDLLNVSGAATWASADTSVATVDENGVVTGVKLGKTTISATVEGVTGTVEIEVVEVADKVTYFHDGGSSEALYDGEEKIASLTLTSYNSNGGSFWGGGYSSNVYLTNKAGDPTATFSDRIYIGLNEYTGFYEIKSILTSGGSSWADGAEYVITISSSYSNYRACHAQVQKLSVGDVVIIKSNNFKLIKPTNTAEANFYKPEVKGDKAVVLKDDYNDELITPVKLGYEFLGWYDANGAKVESLTKDQIKGNVKLYAKWEELNPVTDIVINNVPTEMETDEVFQIEASVTPTDAFFTQILYTTSDPDIVDVTAEGLLTAKNTGKATITVTDFIGKVTKTYEITVNAIPSLDIKFPNDYKGVLQAGETLQLEPTYLGKAVDNLSYTYTSNDSAVATVDGTGLVKAVTNGEAEITIKSSNGKELVIGVTVYGLSEADKVEQVISLLAETAIPEVEVGNACLYNDGTTRYYDSTYGSVNYYYFKEFTIDTTYQAQAVATGSHSGTRAKEDIHFVTVHDTATLTGTGQAMASNMSTSTSVSIHYVVGNGQAFAVLPEEYVAWHAGDGTGVKFQWLATGIKGTEELTKENFDMVKEGDTWYFTINGQKTKVVCPVSNGNREIKNPSKAHFSSLGPTWTIIDGEYYIGTPWASFGQNVNGVISSKGGNNNSVGIEMCVNTSGDIYTSYQVNSQLIADILLRNNLDLTRVKQHNTFDGKNCPQVLLAGNYWAEFMKMIEINYILGKDYKDVKISMVSDNPDIVDNTGRVVNAPQVATTVGYTITVTLGSTTKSIKLYSVVPGTTSWQKWDGIYPSSLIWNEGNFVVNK